MYKVEDFPFTLTTPIPIGRQGETGARQIQFDISELVSGYSEYTIVLAEQRSQDATAFNINSTLSGTTLTWNVDAYDTYYDGHGRIEIRLIKNGIIVKSAVAYTICEKSLTGNEGAPVPSPSWYDELIDKVDTNTQDISDIKVSLDDKLGITDYSAAAAVGTADNLIDRKSAGTAQRWTGLRTSCGDTSIDDDGNAQVVEIVGRTASGMFGVRLTGIKTVGFNAYNPETGKARVLGGNEYQMTGTYTAITHSGGETIEPDVDGLFTPTEDGVLTITGGNDTDTCVHLTWSGYRNGEYEPYWEQTRQIDSRVATAFPNGLHGWAGESQGANYKRTDSVTATKAIQRTKVVNLKNCTISKWEGHTNAWRVTTGFDGQQIPGSNNATANISLLRHPKWGRVAYTTMNVENPPDMSVSNLPRSNRGCIFCDSDYAEYWQADDVEGLKTAMGDVFVGYMLDPSAFVETEFDPPLNLTYKVSDFGTEEALNGTAEGSFNGTIRYSTNYVRVIANLESRKLDIQQDVADAGKVLKIGADGRLIPVAGGGGSTPVTRSVTISAAAWSARFVTVSVTGVTTDNIVQLTPSTKADADLWASCGVFCTAQGNGTLTFTCTSTPTSALSMGVVIW